MFGERHAREHTLHALNKWGILGYGDLDIGWKLGDAPRSDTILHGKIGCLGNGPPSPTSAIRIRRPTADLSGKGKDMTTGRECPDLSHLHPVKRFRVNPETEM